MRAYWQWLTFLSRPGDGRRSPVFRNMKPSHSSDRRTRGIASLPAMSRVGLHPIEERAARGELPLEDRCVICAQTTHQTAVCVMQCEAKGGRYLDWLPKPLLYLIAPIWFVPAMRRSMERQNVAANDRFIELPIRICDRCQNGLKRSPTNLALLVCKTPMYADLFREFPNARIQKMTRAIGEPCRAPKDGS